MVLPVQEIPLGRSVFEAILARRSVRAYTPEILGRNTVHTLLEAAVRAPTAMHEEPWAFVVVQDKQVLKQLSDRAKPIFIEEVRHRNSHGALHSFDHFDKPDFDIFHGAGTLIIICAKPIGQHPDWDCCLAGQNLMLAAHGMGLGTCPIGFAWPLLEQPDVKEHLQIAPEYRPILPIIVGYPRQPILVVPRNEPEILCWK